MQQSKSGKYPFFPHLFQDCEPRTRERLDSEKRSWAAKQGHRRKKESRLKRASYSTQVSMRTDASTCLTTTRPSLQQDFTEGRSLQFFRERTSVEWSGWCDRRFWTSLVPQAAASYPALKHAMISLSAYHESLEVQSESDSSAFRELSVRQGNKALACFRESYDQMPLAAILCFYIVMTEFSAILGIMLYLQTQKA